MNVRALTIDDWPSANALYWELTSSGAVAGRDQFQTVLAHPGTFVFGQEQDGAIVSMATLHILPNMTYGGQPYALVENVVTASARRLQGHGRAVFAEIARVARDHGCYKMMLLTGAKRQARGFYESVGFVTDEKWGMIYRF